MTPPPTVFKASPSTATLPLPFSPKSTQLPPLEPLQETYPTSRRHTAILLSLLISSPLIPSPPASAFSFGISGPKEWLKEQKKKSYKFLLAPVDASRNTLRSAYLLLSKDSDNLEKEAEEVRSLVKSAARDCVAEERNSFVAFQAKTGVEVCTFRLIVNNAASLLDNKDPIKLEAETRLVDLVRSFVFLRNVANEIDVQVDSNRRRVADALTDTLFYLDKFEQGIKNCLDI